MLQSSRILQLRCCLSFGVIFPELTNEIGTQEVLNPLTLTIVSFTSAQLCARWLVISSNEEQRAAIFKTPSSPSPEWASGLRALAKRRAAASVRLIGVISGDFKSGRYETKKIAERQVGTPLL